MTAQMKKPAQGRANPDNTSVAAQVHCSTAAVSDPLMAEYQGRPVEAMTDADRQISRALYHSMLHHIHAAPARAEYPQAGERMGKLLAIANGEGFTRKEARVCLRSIINSGRARIKIGHCGVILVCPTEHAGGGSDE